MRDMYNNIPGFQADQIKYEDDPFYEPAPWFNFVGRSHIYLRNLLYNIPMQITSPIISERGELKGHIVVEVAAPLWKNQEEESDSNATSILLEGRNPWVIHTPTRSSASNPGRDKIERSFQENGAILPTHETIEFSVHVKEAKGISSKEYSEVYCEIRFLTKEASSFSSNPPCKGKFFFLAQKS